MGSLERDSSLVSEGPTGDVWWTGVLGACKVRRGRIRFFLNIERVDFYSATIARGTLPEESLLVEVDEIDKELWAYFKYNDAIYIKGWGSLTDSFKRKVWRAVT